MTARDRNADHRPRLVFLVTDSISARYLLSGQLSFLARSGFEVSLICSPGRHLEEVRAREGIRCHEFSMEREIHLLRDLQCLFGLIRLLNGLRPDILSASTPKAGLLGMLAGALTRVPHRVRTIRGLRLETTRGWKRLLLSLTERVASFCAHRVVCVSASLRDEVLKRRLTSPNKAVVLGAGSSNGVDSSRFHPAATNGSNDQCLSPGLTPETPVVGFVGRLVRDKGIDDLVRAFQTIVLARFPAARLLAIGDFEPGDPVGDATRAFLTRGAEALTPGFVENPAPWYRVMTVLAFPSYREGFPNVPLEAAATQIPTVAYEVTGTVDAIQHENTGILVPAGDWKRLGEALCEYLANPELREAHGLAARDRVLEEFPQQVVWQAWASFYRSGTIRPASERVRL